MDEIILDAIKDTLPIIPVLLVVHLLIEVFEVKKLSKLRASGVLSGGFAPLIGTGVGLLPQCGFSIVASEMYAKRYIKVGTLIAVFIATSDEALPILLGGVAADPSVWFKLLWLIGIKVVMALVAGYTVNLITHKHKEEELQPAVDETPTESHGCCGHALEHSDEGGGEEQKERSAWEKFKAFFSLYLKHPLIHTAVITLFIFIINVVVGGIIHGVGGEEVLAEFMAQGVWLQPLISVLIGLIPNCAASVVITQLYMQNIITLGATVAGLAVNAGLGFAVLFKANKNIKNNFIIMFGLIAYAVAVGYLVTVIELAVQV